MIILDTNALITFLDGEKSSSEYYNLIAALRALLHETIALPMPVISEFIAGDDNEDRALSLIKPGSKFKSLDFDAKAALVAAKIYKDYRASLAKSNQSQRPNQKIKVDLQILGIAIANHASMIVTHDKGIKKIVDCLGLPIVVFDYIDKSYFEQMASVEVTESDRVQ
ncbi:type II toxin-antitoxin system VapC family toxin [Acinetobacter sp. 3657]|uniref:type II toxin-antitoxin system VapC family toxin n=1 Tax=Acinetobacter sp. 3657 TaxID=2817764 RepID=UPI00285E8226|nr:putative nucleic acid-binding protein [Prolinoborus sp. 3657]